jgi:flavin reductase (DIM6/NTAB) family NADH-FMN oxidoreductase RutF
VTVHSEHPFQDPDQDPVRRFRGRLGGTVTLWTTGSGTERAGLTVSSMVVANGEPAHLLALVDPDSDLVDALGSSGAAVVGLLQWEQRRVADAFAGVAPSPGGPFRSGAWTDTDWGPLLEGVSGWAGVRLVGEPAPVGWSLLLDAVVEKVHLGEERAPLVHRRGRYVRPGADR